MFWDTWNKLEEKYVEEIKAHIKNNPNDEIARQRLKSLVLPSFQRLFEGQDYFYAAQWANILYEAGVEGAKDLLVKALKAEYNGQLTKAANAKDPYSPIVIYDIALSNAKRLQELGIEGADELIQQAIDLRDGNMKV